MRARFLGWIQQAWRSRMGRVCALLFAVVFFTLFGLVNAGLYGGGAANYISWLEGGWPSPWFHVVYHATHQPAVYVESEMRWVQPDEMRFAYVRVTSCFGLLGSAVICGSITGALLSTHILWWKFLTSRNR